MFGPLDSGTDAYAPDLVPPRWHLLRSFGMPLAHAAVYLVNFNYAQLESITKYTGSTSKAVMFSVDSN